MRIKRKPQKDKIDPQVATSMEKQNRTPFEAIKQNPPPNNIKLTMLSIK